MTTEDVERIEQSLRLTLPQQYSDILLAYPSERDSDSCEWSLFGDAERIIAENAECRSGGFFGQAWPASYLIIGGDGTGNAYYLDLRQPNSPVYEADHGATASSQRIEAEQAAPDLAAWVTYIQEENAEIEAEEAARREKEQKVSEARGDRKWWQFWV